MHRIEIKFSKKHTIFQDLLQTADKQYNIANGNILWALIFTALGQSAKTMKVLCIEDLAPYDSNISHWKHHSNYSLFVWCALK